MKPTLTLISDWRLRDPYLAIFKAALQNEIPESNLLDITHHVDLNSLKQTAFLMKQTYMHFPEGSIHLLLTNVSFRSDFDPVVLAFENHIFIGEDNGIFSLIAGPQAKLSGRKYKKSDSLTAIDKMIALTKAVIEKKLDKITEPYSDFARKFMPEAINFANTKTIEGEIIYIDAYFNAITNIPIDMFMEATGGKNFQGTIQSKQDWPVNEFHPQYVDTSKFFFTESALGCLEIAYHQGKIAVLADLKVGDKVEIQY
ncbi:MAG: SAM-dependent chlorinase/fluorinase [Bacteroidales bacterium]|nr:SAM-dependent chlorinase/fluorinase [Bacteroidales bacterium]